ncbi:hypothetical protein BV898_12524 [Hypsibius exemplaris]|uniref:Uncharacterized protein n=1 Tax=Hypsibius exemplaris TaxID=2072580 RepID=A0A1W0WDC9_HYPEX|nr:hypothetical protein BV898_12524 [Hypsibius exemplaris]
MPRGPADFFAVVMSHKMSSTSSLQNAWAFTSPSARASRLKELMALKELHALSDVAEELERLMDAFCADFKLNSLFLGKQERDAGHALGDLQKHDRTGTGVLAIDLLLLEHFTWPLVKFIDCFCGSQELGRLYGLFTELTKINFGALPATWYNSYMPSYPGTSCQACARAPWLILRFHAGIYRTTDRGGDGGFLLGRRARYHHGGSCHDARLGTLVGPGQTQYPYQQSDCVGRSADDESEVLDLFRVGRQRPRSDIRGSGG